MGLKIDIGCGSSPAANAMAREGYTGVDMVEGPGVGVVCDVRDGLPFKDGEVEAISSSHFLEHLGFDELMPFMKECGRVLKPWGLFECVVPDFEWLCEAFLNTPEDRRWEFPIMTMFGNQSGPGEFHKNGFTKKRLLNILLISNLKPLRILQVWTHNQFSIYAAATKNGKVDPSSLSRAIPRPTMSPTHESSERDFLGLIGESKILQSLETH